MKCQQIVILFLLFCTSTFGQKKYSFDYMLEYEYQTTDTSKVEIQYFLTNSKDNSYCLYIQEKDSLNLKLIFIDYNGTKSTAHLDKISFAKAESVSLDCKIISKFDNRFKGQTKNYDYNIEKDTLIDGSYYHQYILKSNNPKRESRKQTGSKVFVVEKNTSFHLPVFDHETSYEEWKLERNIPNGVPKVTYVKSYDGTEKYLIFRLVQYVPIKKYLIIPEKCDYSKILN